MFRQVFVSSINGNLLDTSEGLRRTNLTNRVVDANTLSQK